MGIKNRIKKVLNKILKMNTSSSSTGTPSIVIQEINHPHQQNSQDIINTQSTYPNYTDSEINNMNPDQLNDCLDSLNELSLSFDASIREYAISNRQLQQIINRSQTQIRNYDNLNNQLQQFVRVANINRALTQPSPYVNSFGNGMPIGRAATTSNIPNQSINFNPPNDTNTQSTYPNYTDAEINNINRSQTQINQDYTQFFNFINQPQQESNGTPIAEEAPPSYVSVFDDPYLYQNNETHEQSNILTRSDSSRSVHSNTSIASSTRTENSMAVNTGHNVGSDISTHNQSTASSSYYSIGSTLRGLIEENNYYYDNIDNISLTSDNSRPISTDTSDNLPQTGQATPTLH
ncbi:MAG: hypothetical protein K5769_05990 [Pseudobutyrivibrio sp.]|nr:hypothetical protein [Pseudobutyrivibrio sp.]